MGVRALLLAPGSRVEPRGPSSSGVRGREEQGSGEGGRARGAGVGRRGGGGGGGARGWEMEKQTLFSARLWREGSRGPQALRVKQFQIGMSVCFSLERRLKTPKALGFSSHNILFWKVQCEKVEEMRKILHKWKRPFPSLNGQDGEAWLGLERGHLRGRRGACG